MEKYYNVKYKSKPDAYGIVVKVKEGKLEAITGGETALKRFGAYLDKKGNLNVGKKYFYDKMSKYQAEKLKNIEKEHIMKQLYFSENGSSHLFGPGDDALY